MSLQYWRNSLLLSVGLFWSEKAVSRIEGEIMKQFVSSLVQGYEVEAKDTLDKECDNLYVGPYCS